MDREIFAERFQAAAAAALSFARQFVLEDLSNELLFRVLLNQSNDANLRSDEKVHPEDSVPKRGHELHRCGDEEAIQALWRESTVPEWVDASVAGQTANESIVELRCCGRFTADESRLYHQTAGMPPFSVKGPVLPPKYRSGERFSIWHRLSIWGLDELEIAMPNIHKVWSLTTFGSQIDDSILENLPTFSNVEVIELKESPIHGKGLRSLSRHPKLRVLRIDLARPEFFDLKETVVSRNLEVLDIRHLPPRPCGLEEFLEQLPALKWLALASDGNISFNGSISGTPDFLAITADNIVGAANLPYSVGHLVVKLNKATPSDLSRLLRNVKKLRALSLTHTPVDDDLTEELVARLKPEYVNLVHTNVTISCLRRLKDMYPNLRIHPAN